MTLVYGLGLDAYYSNAMLSMYEVMRQFTLWRCSTHIDVDVSLYLEMMQRHHVMLIEHCGKSYKNCNRHENELPPKKSLKSVYAHFKWKTVFWTSWLSDIELISFVSLMAFAVTWWRMQKLPTHFTHIFCSDVIIKGTIVLCFPCKHVLPSSLCNRQTHIKQTGKKLCDITARQKFEWS